MPTPDGAMTLAEYAQRDALILFVCTTCHHSGTMPAGEAAARFGPDREAYALEARARCSQCHGGCRQSFRFPLSGPDRAPGDPHNFSTPGRREPDRWQYGAARVVGPGVHKPLEPMKRRR